MNLPSPRITTPKSTISRLVHSTHPNKGLGSHDRRKPQDEVRLTLTTLSRQLALDLYQSFPTIDGLAYRSRYNNGQICYALFDRVDLSDLVAAGTVNFDEHPSIVDSLMTLYGAVFDTSSAP